MRGGGWLNGDNCRIVRFPVVLSRAVVMDTTVVATKAQLEGVAAPQGVKLQASQNKTQMHKNREITCDYNTKLASETPDGQNNSSMRCANFFCTKDKQNFSSPIDDNRHTRITLRKRTQVNKNTLLLPQ